MGFDDLKALNQEHASTRGGKGTNGTPKSVRKCSIRAERGKTYKPRGSRSRSAHTSLGTGEPFTYKVR